MAKNFYLLSARLGICRQQYSTLPSAVDIPDGKARVKKIGDVGAPRGHRSLAETSPRMAPGRRGWAWQHSSGGVRTLWRAARRVHTHKDKREGFEHSWRWTGSTLGCGGVVLWRRGLGHAMVEDEIPSTGADPLRWRYG